ncbi:TPA: PerC family transcriptional regulator, partial [Escherichia coli]
AGCWRRASARWLVVMGAADIYTYITRRSFKIYSGDA